MEKSAEVERARRILRHLIELSGLSRRQVGARLAEQGSGTDLPRVLSGRLQLKLRHILDIAGVLGLHPLEFFRMVFKPPTEPSPFLRRLEFLIAPHRAMPREPGREELEELQRRLSVLEGEVGDLRSAAASRSGQANRGAGRRGA